MRLEYTNTNSKGRPIGGMKVLHNIQHGFSHSQHPRNRGSYFLLHIIIVACICNSQWSINTESKHFLSKLAIAIAEHNLTKHYLSELS